MKVLIVDDHPMIREVLRHRLTNINRAVTVVEASDCAQCMSAFDLHGDFDMVLLDLDLPDSDGFEALAKISARSRKASVVIVSASDQPAFVIHAIDMGATGFIPKSSSSEVFAQALRMTMGGRKYLPFEVLYQHQTGGLPSVDKSATLTPHAIGLTPRQSEVLSLLIQGKSNKVISREMNLAEGTVKIHVTSILSVLRVSNRTQATIVVGKLGLQLPLAVPRPPRQVSVNPIPGSSY